MRQKELRIALVCYGGVSLAVYMHGVTKELWHLARASRAHHAADGQVLDGVAKVYSDLIAEIEAKHSLRLRVLPDILTGASAGGINAIFLAQALHSGHSLDTLTDLWLHNADVSELTDPDAEPMWRFAKIWAQPLADWVLRRPGSGVSESVAPETRAEVRHKVSRLVRGRWFKPPFSGDRFSGMLYEALENMAANADGHPLLPDGHPIDLFVSATDYRGHVEVLRLHSPSVVHETEHRLPIGFSDHIGTTGKGQLGDRLELVLAARATASFPGAFPPLSVGEIDRLAEAKNHPWKSRGNFLSRIMPGHVRDGTLADVALIDGAVLVNAPFGAALKALRGRPAQREVDRRFVYIDPRPDSRNAPLATPDEPIGFFGTILGSLSSIPRRQPIRDNLERIEEQSRNSLKLRSIIMGMRPDIDRTVEKLFGMTFFLNRPTQKRLANWRAKSQQAAIDQSGYTFNAYAQTKMSGIIERLSDITQKAAPERSIADTTMIAQALRQELGRRDLTELVDSDGVTKPETIAFFRAHDVGYRIRRLQLLAQRLSRDWEIDAEIPDDALDLARERIYDILAVYFGVDDAATLGSEFKSIAANAVKDPGAVLDYLSMHRLLPETDAKAEQMLTEALEAMPKNLKRRMLLTYLGFPFFDVATLPLLQRDGLGEYNPVKVDRISPEDARSIREGGTSATLRGTEFYNFGAFFSRAYRENDYLWGRLHGAERMVDFVTSTVESGVAKEDIRNAKRAAFFAIIEEEMKAGRCEKKLLEQLKSEIQDRFN